MWAAYVWREQQFYLLYSLYGNNQIHNDLIVYGIDL